MIWKKVESLRLTISMLLLTIVSILNAQNCDTTQNLVVNPSFEEHTACPEFENQLNLCVGWKSYLNSSDYFNPCFYDSVHYIIQKQHQYVNIPQNMMGYQNPRTGKAYVGIAEIDLSDYSYKEYIQTKLKESLEKDKKYQITMYVSLADSSMYASDRFRFCLTKGATFNKISKSKQYDQIESEEGILVKTESLMTDTINWVKILAIYLAKGGEQYLTIGVFKNDMTKKEYRNISVYNSNTKYPYAYYYIDDVSVIEKKEQDFTR